jgi:iron complex transport system ATP-binding protein
VIELRGVALSVGDRPLLGGIDAQVRGGEFVALLGPNGAGKTTLLRAIAGLHRLDAGTIELDGVPTTRLEPLERARRIAFVTGDEVLLDALGVADVVAIGRFPHHRWWEWRTQPADARAIALSLDAVGMAAFAQRLFSTLSAGERQRAWIALGLAQETPILLLDEPTSHLDVRVAHEILGLLRRLARAGKTMVCALHDINEAAAYADRIALVGNGRLLAMAAPDALLNDLLLDRTYGVALERLRLPDGRLRVFVRDEDSVASVCPSRAPNA